jgi:hypothetical protein
VAKIFSSLFSIAISQNRFYIDTTELTHLCNVGSWKHRNGVEVAQIRFLRTLVGTTRKDRIRGEEILQ